MSVSWNVVVTLEGRGFSDAVELLSYYGRVATTDFYNVVLLEVDDLLELLERLRLDAKGIAEVDDHLSRVLPVQRTFRFGTREELEERAKAVLSEWIPRLSGKSFYVRMHRRGKRRALSSQEIEQSLAGFVLDALDERDDPGEVDFGDPDLVVDLETVGGEAGLALWTREEIERYPFLRLD